MTPFQKIVELKKSIKQKFLEKGKENNFINKSIGEINVQKIDKKVFNLNLEPLKVQRSAFKERKSILRKFEHMHLQDDYERFSHRNKLEEQTSPLISEHIQINQKENDITKEANSKNKEILNENTFSEREGYKEENAANNKNNYYNKKDYGDKYKCLRNSVFLKNYELENESLKENQITNHSRETQTTIHPYSSKTTVFFRNNLTSVHEKITN